LGEAAFAIGDSSPPITQKLINEIRREMAQMGFPVPEEFIGAAFIVSSFPEEYSSAFTEAEKIIVLQKKKKKRKKA
jgi:hypothetical protein